MATNLWLAGARPKTLPAAVVPVAVGTAAATTEEFGLSGISLWRALLCLVVALALQIGTNFANDYSDGVRGTDSARLGPLRLVGGGHKPARSVKQAAMVSFGVAAVAGLGLSYLAGWELLLVGAASIAAGWFYTGGSKPYGYSGFGELFVFVFFGLVATVGSAFVQPNGDSMLALGGAIPVGMLATALLVANNLRDIPSDMLSDKRTLAVRIGDPATRRFLVGLVFGAFVCLVPLTYLRPLSILAFAAIPTAIRALGPVLSGAKGTDLIPVLENTGKTQLVFGIGLALGWMVLL